MTLYAGLDRIISPHWQVRVGLTGEVSQITRIRHHHLAGLSAARHADVGAAERGQQRRRSDRRATASQLDVTPYVDFGPNNDFFAIIRLTGRSYFDLARARPQRAGGARLVRHRARHQRRRHPARQAVLCRRRRLGARLRLPERGPARRLQQPAGRRQRRRGERRIPPAHRQVVRRRGLRRCRQRLSRHPAQFLAVRAAGRRRRRRALLHRLRAGAARCRLSAQPRATAIRRSASMSAWGRPSDARAPHRGDGRRRRGRAAGRCCSPFLQTPPGQRALAGARRSRRDVCKCRASAASSRPTCRSARIELVGRAGPVAHGRRRAPALVVRLAVRRAVSGSRCCRPRCVDVLRAPLPRKRPDSAGGGSGSFKLPVGVDLQALSVDDLHLAAPLGRRRLALDACTATACCPADLHEGRLRLDRRPHRRPAGKLAADARFDLGSAPSMARSRSRKGRAAWWRRCCERPDLDGVVDAPRRQGRCGRRQRRAHRVGGRCRRRPRAARSWQPTARRPRSRVRLEARPGKALPDAGAADLARRRGDGGRHAGDLERARRSPPGRSASPPRAATTARPTGSTATATVRCRRAGPAWRRSWAASTGAACISARTPCSAPGEAARRHGDAERRRRRSRGRRRSTVACRRSASTTLDATARRAARRQADARVRSTRPRPWRSVKGGAAPICRKTETGEVKATVELPSLAPFSALAERQLVGTRPSRPDGAQRWRRPDVRLAGHARPMSARPTCRPTWWRARSRCRAAPPCSATSPGRCPTCAWPARRRLPFGRVRQRQGQTGKFDLPVELRPKARPAVLAIGQGRLKLQATARPSARSTMRRLPSGGRLDDARRAALDGERRSSRAKPLSLAGRFDRDAAGGIVVPSFEGHWASAVLDVTDLASRASARPGSARLKDRAAAGRGARCSGTDLAGAIDAEVTTDPQLAAGTAAGARATAPVFEAAASASARCRSTPRSTIPRAPPRPTPRSRPAASRRGRHRPAQRHGEGRPAERIRRRAAGLGRAPPPPPSPPRSSRRAKRSASRLSRFDGRHQGIPVALERADAAARSPVAQIAIDPTTLRLGGGRLSPCSGVLDPAASDLSSIWRPCRCRWSTPLRRAPASTARLQAQAARRRPDGQPAHRRHLHRVQRAAAPARGGAAAARSPCRARPRWIGTPGQRRCHASAPARGSSLSLKGKATRRRRSPAPRQLDRLDRHRAFRAAARQSTCAASPAPCAPISTLDIRGTKITGTGTARFRQRRARLARDGPAAERRHGPPGAAGRHAAAAAALLPDRPQRQR